ncbi:glycerophosphodiester phosphodiesterase family protein [Microbispora sp. H11081]|uniref:glycerophosphodiester phosphodiesterase family protein n=1 Tax=Microbispora sp. H11081 TaxID=2729107 RepID=UPI0028A0C6D8|nr:glycerophosphodiester phosphodiesterase family protein [Microbispora sp. H11081]
MTKALVGEAHELGLKVIPCTVEEKSTMNAMIDAGVDGIITDYPDRLREVMADRVRSSTSASQRGDRRLYGETGAESLIR